MKQKSIVCPHCTSQICTEIISPDEKFKIWNCFSCGYTSNSTLVEKHIEKVEETLPELFKDLRFIDENGFYWYPLSVMLDNKAMVFPEGKSVDDWKWSAVQSKDGKVDMTTKKEFEQNQFVYALEYIDYFSQK